MSFNASSVDILKLDRVAIAIEPYSWRFASAQRKRIDRHFARVARERSGLWNGRVLLLNRYSVENSALHGACFETDYASFLAWREWDFPDHNIKNFFAAAALRAADGAFLVGEMAPYTAGALQLCFPCGTPEPGDIAADGVVDLAANLSRELREETGLDIDDLDAEQGWTALCDRGFVALLKQVRARHNAEELRCRIMRYLAMQAQPEFSDICIVRGSADLDDRMPRFVIRYLEELGGGAGTPRRAHAQ